LPNDLAKIIGFLQPWREKIFAVVVESTYNRYWLVDGLQEAGFVVKLVNTGAIMRMMKPCKRTFFGAEQDQHQKLSICRHC